jgi:hypothetical protein
LLKEANTLRTDNCFTESPFFAEKRGSKKQRTEAHRTSFRRSEPELKAKLGTFQVLKVEMDPQPGLCKY